MEAPVVLITPLRSQAAGTLAGMQALAPVPPAPAPPAVSVGKPPSTNPPTNVDEYYAAAQGRTGVALLRSLGQIIRNGHTDQGYNFARDILFGAIEDPGNANAVVDVYTGARISGISDRKTAFERGLNTEHTWPQSQGARGIAQSDLHQLQPADIKINQIRGALPYGDVKVPDWSGDSPDPDRRSVRGRDEAGDQVFQPPAAVRGNIARGLLYFYTRYNQSRPADYTLDAFRKELPTLLRWSRQDPVDDAERWRNEAVFQVQHNRNPFVDHPEWIDAIDFTRIGV